MFRADFDTVCDRRIPGDIKYSPIEGVPDVLPMWIADMDFRVPPAVSEALSQTVSHGIFGYTDTDEEYDRAVVSWYKNRMNWETAPSAILKMPGVMFAVAASIRALTEPGDSVLICQPVYHPFAKIVTANDRRLAVSELRFADGRYEIDFGDFEDRIVQEKVKLFLLCSPHNPVGHVWSVEELMEIGRICLKHSVLIVSDEIHSDIIYPGWRHTPIASLSDELAGRCVTCTSPTKTFNLAGLQAANIIIPNEALRRKVRRAGLAAGYSSLNSMAIAATKAAYLGGAEWLAALLEYLQGNISLVKRFCAETGGKISLSAPEGTYLLWLDCRGLGRTDNELEELFLYRAGVRLNRGTMFGRGVSGFMRMNIACPGSVLAKALERIERVI